MNDCTQPTTCCSTYTPGSRTVRHCADERVTYCDGAYGKDVTYWVAAREIGDKAQWLDPSIGCYPVSRAQRRHLSRLRTARATMGFSGEVPSMALFKHPPIFPLCA